MAARVFGGRGRSGDGPVVDLDFTRCDSVVSDLITCSGGANGTRVNAAGLIVPATCPRIDFDPVTLECRGLLVEEARTNAVPQSSLFSAWSSDNLTVTDNTISSPVGLASTVTATADGTSALTRSFTVGGTALTFTCWTKKTAFSGTATCGRAYGFYNLTTGLDLGYAIVDHRAGTCTLTDFAGGSTASIEDWGNGWFRVRISVVAGMTAGNSVNVYAGTVGAPYTAGETYYVAGAQVEEASFPTSYIPTTSAAVTRTADHASALVSSLGLGSHAGTVHMEFFWSKSAGVGGEFDLFMTDATGIQAFVDGSNIVVYAKNTVDNSQIGVGVLVQGLNRFTMVYDAASGIYSGLLNGTAYWEGPWTLGAPITGTVLHIGEHSSGSSQLGETIARLATWSRALSKREQLELHA